MIQHSIAYYDSHGLEKQLFLKTITDSFLC